jgi:hypothetical protein
MTLPIFLFALLTALLYGALYHFVRGGNGWRILLYFGLSILGFIAGHSFGMWQGWHLFMIGSLNMGMGTIGSILFLAVGEWLSRVEVNRKSSV